MSFSGAKTSTVELAASSQARVSPIAPEWVPVGEKIPTVESGALGR